jgi:hypothetical protein
MPEENLHIIRNCFQMWKLPWPNSGAFIPKTEEKNPNGNYNIA